MNNPYIYYVPIYPDDDCSEALMHLFNGEPNLDDQILDLLNELDERELKGEGVDYVRELETRLDLERILVRHVPRDRSRHVVFTA
jgi:hypothetical protein